MSNPITDLPWQSLASRGFLHVREFLTPPELAKLRNDYEAQFARGAANGNYDVPLVSPLLTWRFEPKLQAVGAVVQAAAGICADMTVAGLYFSTAKGISFAWHQDHESFFMYQQHADYLNFYIPVIKPEVAHTNLCVIPFDRLAAQVPERCYRRLAGSGAARLFPDGCETRVCDDEHGEEYTLPVNIEELKVTPEMAPGDLLLMRGDMIHRTQDTQTERVAVSFRRTRAASVINRARLLSGASAKREMMQKNGALFAPLLACFETLKQEEITAKQLAAYFHDRNRPVPRAPGGSAP